MDKVCVNLQYIVAHCYTVVICAKNFRISFGAYFQRGKRWMISHLFASTHLYYSLI